jgi:hypothetical protein
MPSILLVGLFITYVLRIWLFNTFSSAYKDFKYIYLQDSLICCVLLYGSLIHTLLLIGLFNTCCSEDSSLLGCYGLSSVKELPMFRSIMLPSSYGSRGPRRISLCLTPKIKAPRSSETSASVHHSTHC